MDIWQLTTPLDAVIFDCDGTLSQIEGIDVLAGFNQVSDVVREMTEAAMGDTGLSPELYAQRLEKVKPTQAQVSQLGALYYAHVTPGVDQLIKVLGQLNKPVYVISAGLLPSVADFATRLGVPRDQVFAVELLFDEVGCYRGYDALSPLTQKGGKGVIIQEIKKQFPRLMHVGDGMNDVEVADQVTRFVGYGGSFYRENIARSCAFYINTLSLLSLLPLCLTQEEVGRLEPASLMHYQQGLADIKARRVLY